jgi:pimeloyl-ACP methyl ester carboxylesterase
LKGEFCRTVTTDGIELQSFLAEPAGEPAEDWVLHVHGLAGNFYENRFVDHVAGAVTGAGLGFVTTNNRGHDYISDFIVEKAGEEAGYVQIGGIYEILSECVEDIAAWIDFLRARGGRRVVLEGHSHGALKVVHYLHHRPDAGVAGLVLLSPSDDFGCQRARLGSRFDEGVETARTMVETGKGRDLMPEGFFHYPVSARTYLDIFKPDSDLKIFNTSLTDSDDLAALASVRVPVLAMVGSVEEAFVQEPEEYLASIEKHLTGSTDFTGRVLWGAPHNYMGHDAEAARAIGEWLAGRFGARRAG